MPHPPPDFTQQSQQPQFGIPGAAAGYFQQGEQQHQQAAMPMGAQGVAFGGPPVGAPPGPHPGDGAWADVSEVNPLGTSGGHDREAKRQARQRNRAQREQELNETTARAEQMQLDAALALSRQHMQDWQEDVDEHLEQAVHASTIDWLRAQQEGWEQGREDYRQGQGPEYRVNMVRDLQLFIPQSSSASTSLSDLQEQLWSPVSIVTASVQGVEPEEVTSPASVSASRRTAVRRLGWGRRDEHAVTPEGSRSRAIARRRRSRLRDGMRFDGVISQRLLE